MSDYKVKWLIWIQMFSFILTTSFFKAKVLKLEVEIEY